MREFQQNTKLFLFKLLENKKRNLEEGNISEPKFFFESLSTENTNEAKNKDLKELNELSKGHEVFDCPFEMTRPKQRKVEETKDVLHEDEDSKDDKSKDKDPSGEKPEDKELGDKKSNNEKSKEQESKMSDSSKPNRSSRFSKSSDEEDKEGGESIDEVESIPSEEMIDPIERTQKDTAEFTSLCIKLLKLLNNDSDTLESLLNIKKGDNIVQPLYKAVLNQKLEDYIDLLFYLAKKFKIKLKNYKIVDKFREFTKSSIEDPQIKKLMKSLSKKDISEYFFLSNILLF